MNKKARQRVGPFHIGLIKNYFLVLVDTRLRILKFL